MIIKLTPKEIVKYFTQDRKFILTRLCIKDSVAFGLQKGFTYTCNCKVYKPFRRMKRAWDESFKMTTIEVDQTNGVNGYMDIKDTELKEAKSIEKTDSGFIVTGEFLKDTYVFDAV